MSLFRNVNISFWTDTKIVDEYTPEDKYFMLYAMTNQYTNIIGCYEISIKQMSNDLGYTKDVVERIINRFKEVHKTIDYNNETKELLIKNWYKYNWNISPKLDKPLYSNIEKIKCNEFHDYLASVYNQRTTIEETIPYRYGIEKNEYPIDTTITITNTIPITSTISNTNTNTKEKEINKEKEKQEVEVLEAEKQEQLNTVVAKEKIPYTEIIEYLNFKTGRNYNAKAKCNKDVIKARFNEGATLDQFKQVIDKKVLDWLNDKKMNIYLRPTTLFGTKFDSYLNQGTREITTNDLAEHYNFDEFR